MERRGSSQSEKLHTLVRENDKAGVEKLLKEWQGEHMVEYNVDGVTALHVAAHNGNTDMVEVLKNVGNANIHARSRDGNTPLHMAALGGHEGVVEKLLKYGAISDINTEDRQGNTPLHAAAQSGKHEIIKRMLSLAPNRQSCISAKNGQLRTPLHYAAGSNNPEAVKLLLDTKEQQELKEAHDEFGAIPFHFAARSGHVESLKMLAPKDVNLTCKNGFTALHYAAWNGRSDAANWLVENGVSLTGNDKKDTPLHLAAICKKPGSDKVAEIIVRKDPDSWKMENLKEESAIGLADQHEHGDVVRAILRSLRRFKPSVNGNDILKPIHSPINATLLHYAAGHGTKEDIDWLLKALNVSEINVNNIVDESSRAPLHWAAMKGNISTLRALASAEANLTQVGSKAAGERPLFLALGGRHMDVAEELLKCDKERSKIKHSRRLTTDEWMEGVDYWLMTYYNEKVDKQAKDELENGFKHHTRRQSGAWLPSGNEGAMAAYQEIPPLYLALHAGRLDIAKFFQRLSSDEDAVNKKGLYTGRTALHWAVLLRKRGIVEQLCSKVSEFSERVRVCEEDVYQIAPVQYATEMSMQDIEAELFKHDAVAKYIEGLYRDRQIYVDSTNAILVGAALIASVTFAGWLQPPLGYIDYPPRTEEYAAIQQEKGVRVFWVFNSLSFFAAIGTVQAGACGVIPLRQVHIGRAVNYIRRALMVASLLMALSVVCVLGAFGAAGFVVLPPIFKFELYMMCTVIFGGIINAGLILWFVQRVFVAPRLFHVWRRHLLGTPDLTHRSSPPPDLTPTDTSQPTIPMDQQKVIFPWDDGIEKLYSPKQPWAPRPIQARE